MIRSTMVMMGAVAMAAAAQAQVVPQLKLGPATPLPGVEFSRVSDARELSDGRLLIGDALEKQLLVVDFARGTGVKLGRNGAGPGEYRTVGRLLAAGKDTTLLVDNGGGRWLIMARDSFVGVVANGPAMEGGRNPFGADSRGHVLGSKPGRRVDNAVGGINAGQVNGTLNVSNDTSWIVRVDRQTGKLDTLAKYRIRPARIAARSSGGVTTSISVLMNPISTGEQAVLFADGAVAIARMDPYRVDWIIDGRTISGAPLPFTAVPVTRGEKVAALSRLTRSDGSRPSDPDSVTDWPEVVPPFFATGVQAGDDGNVWIRRMPSLRAPGNDYDVVDRAGRLKGRLHLPANELIVTVGRSAIYVVATDDDDLQHLKRYRIP